MSSRDALRRLLSWKSQGPLPRGAARPWPIAPDEHCLVLCFLRMAGETLPWGVALGRPDSEPEIYSVPDPRKIDDVIAMLVKIAPTILDHLPHPSSLPDQSLLEDPDFLPFAPLRQLWLPGATHLTMLHLLEYRLAPARRAEDSILKVINPLGRALGWLFRESTRQGQFRVMDATSSLRQIYDFPAEDLRQQHLGYLMAWLERASEAARRRAEREAVSTTLDPALESGPLAALLERYNRLLNGVTPDPAITETQNEIAEVLRPELERRWRLTVQARAAILNDSRPENPELKSLLDLARDEFRWQYFNLENPQLKSRDPESKAFRGAHPETDSYSPAAAARFFVHQASAELVQSELLHGDVEKVNDAIDAGDAFRGEITAVHDEGKGRKSIPVWKVLSRSDGLMRLREGSSVCLFGARKRSGKIRDVLWSSEGRLFEIVIDNWIRANGGLPAANDAEALLGTTVILVAAGGGSISHSKSFKVWNKDSPGAWLTHAMQAPVPDPPPRLKRDLIDFVERLGGP